MIAWLWHVVAMGGLRFITLSIIVLCRLETPWLSWLLTSLLPLSRPWIQPRRRRCTAWDSPSPRARGMTRGSWDGGWLMAKARRCSSDTWPNWRRRAGRWRINRRRTRRDRGCWRPLRTLMRCKQQRSLWSRRRQRVDLRKILLGSVMIGSQSGLVPDGSTWREFHPHQNKKIQLPEKGARPGRRWCSAWSSRNVKFWHCNTFGSFKHFLSFCRWWNLKPRRCLKWLPRQVQCLNKVFPSSQKLCCEVEGFNMVQRHFAPSSLPQLLSLSVTESQCTGGVDAGNGQSEAMKH